MIASTAGAASLGRLAVLSAIGEPLRAEIELSVSPEELDSVSPRLAAIDDYAAAGLTYNPALNGARLSVQYRENGRRVIHLLTLRPVNEPVIALMVEVNMRGGRTTRAYNALLGPAGDAPVSVAAPAAAATVVAPVITAAPAEKPAPVAKRATEAKPAAESRPVTPPAPKAPRAEKPAVAAPPAKAAVQVDDAAYDRELNRLATQLNAGDKILKDMLSRVTVMEGQVAQLQKAFATLPTPKPATEKAASEKPVTEKAVPEKVAVKPAEKAAEKVTAEKPVAEKTPAEKPAVPPAAEKPVAEPVPVITDPTKPAVPPAVPVMQEVQGQTTTRIDSAPRTPHKSNYMLNEALLVLAGGALALFIGLGYVMLGRRRAAKIAEAEAAIAAETQSAA